MESVLLRNGKTVPEVCRILKREMKRIEMDENMQNGSGYKRYHIHAEKAGDVDKWPSRFKVDVKRSGLAKLIVGEVFHYGLKNKDVILSRPCMYGVFSGPVGGFMPREEHCVGCLRCTTEFPDFVRVSHNPARRSLGDSYFDFRVVDSVSYEAESGLVPVKGAGYRGKFGGEGWDGMWTDMSEIVRPTRDGIHGREFISTVVDIGARPNFLMFDEGGKPMGRTPQVFQIPLPIVFDRAPKSVANEKVWRILAETAEELQSLAVIPLGAVLQFNLESDFVVPLVKASEADALKVLSKAPRLIEMDGWDEGLFRAIHDLFPESLVALRIPYTSAKELIKFSKKGLRVFHLTANYHGQDAKGNFVLDLIREAHKAFVEAGIRQEVTLIGSGGMIHAEHVPKAILCGLDAVGMDTAAIVALQGRFKGECLDAETAQFNLPGKLSMKWGVQRLVNLAASWRDQLLEIMGAMGLREVRRLRGEMGRAMFMKELERDAFAGVVGYEPGK
ncbi:MAG: hypothetical protein EPO32_03515 [Anaerolineae bacterium]|nr:MAG: hypothetical protein EPO32_03515 [Anaerolineae bacterium]